MATVICFSGLGGDSITVEETPEQLLQVVRDSCGIPLRLTLHGLRDGVYINPERIACWYPSVDEGRDPPLVARPFKGAI
jgi:hypothetical protein